MTRHLSIQIFAGLFSLSLLLSCALAYQATSHLTFGFPIAPEAAAALATRIQLIRAAGIGFAVLLALFVVLAGSRAARGALAARWILGVVTSAAFLRGAGLLGQLPQNDTAVIAASAFQLCLEAFAILFLYGEDANEWFDSRRFKVQQQ